MNRENKAAAFHPSFAISLLLGLSCAVPSSGQNAGKPAASPKRASQAEASLYGPAGYLVNGLNYEELVSKIRIAEIKTKLSSLPEKERATAGKLLEIIPHVDAIYRRQRSGEIGDKIIAALKNAETPRVKAALRLVEMNSGPYDPWRDNISFFNAPAYPKNGFAYPEDMTKASFDRYIEAHPEQKAALYSPYTIIQYGGELKVPAEGRVLATVYYHDAFAEEVRAVAALLKEAAALTGVPELKTYLASKAEGLLKDDYDASYADWIAMKDAPLDLVVGPAESYEDSITNVKQNYSYALYAKDDHGADVISKFLARSGDMGRDLPIDKQFNPYLKDKDFKPARNMEAVNMIALGGESLTFTAEGWTLPNEPEIVARHGTKMLLIRNVIETRGFEAMDFLQRRLFGEPYDPRTFYWLVAGHELSHGMLPMTEGFDPKGRALNEALGDLTMPVEEQKADLLGMVDLEELAKAGDLPWDDYWKIARALVGADAVFTYYRSPDEAHAKYKVVVYNMLKERHALQYDRKAGQLKLNKNFPEAMRDIAGVFLKIEARADKALAERLLKEKNAVPHEMAAAISALKKADLPSRTYYKTVIED